MRVLHVAHSAQPGGSNAVLLSLLRHAPPDADNAVVFLEDGPVAAEVPAPVALVDAGRARELWKAPAAVRALRGAARAHGADVVAGHITKAHLYAWAAARLEGLPYLWFQHERRSQKPLMHDLSGRLRSDAVICCSEWVAAEQRERYPATPVVAVQPGPEVGPPGEPRRHAAGPVRIGVAGRLQRWKRVELALRAMPAVLAAQPEARLEVLGDAAPGVDERYPDELRAEAARLGVAHAVDFRGHVADGAGRIAALDLLVHCAEQEPFGLVLVEAMLAGVPVVAADEGGAREIVRDGVDGLRVDATDARALAGAILALARDPGRRAQMGAAGRERALERFTAERMAQASWSVVRAVAGRPGAPGPGRTRARAGRPAPPG